MRDDEYLADLVLLDGRRRPSPPTYVRSTSAELDRAVVRALFAPNPMLVEDQPDRAVAETFWRALAKPLDPGANGASLPAPVRAPEQLGVDFVNCEGAGEMPMMARLLSEAGKNVFA